jgi:hypothetical protein
MVFLVDQTSFADGSGSSSGHFKLTAWIYGHNWMDRLSSALLTSIVCDIVGLDGEECFVSEGMIETAVNARGLYIESIGFRHRNFALEYYWCLIITAER